MAHYDKYEPISGGFRAELEVAITPDGNGEFGPKAVSLNSSGRLIVGTGGVSGLVGILVKNAPKQPLGRYSTNLQAGTPNPNMWLGLRAGDVVDVMTSGEIVGIEGLGWTPGQAIYAASDGSLTATASGNTKIGYVVGGANAQTGTNKMRLVVRVAA